MPTDFHISFTPEELPGLRQVIDRAMNTWEPHDQPPWLGQLSEQVDRAMGRHVRQLEANANGKVVGFIAPPKV